MAWLHDGDKNTRYFHQKTSNHLRKNSIKGLFDDNGVRQPNAETIENLVMDYFSNMVVSSGNTDYNDVLDSVPSCVTSEMNQILLAPCADVEIKEALFQIDPHMAPGPDRMSPLFFQKSWDIIDVHVVCAVRSFFFSSGCILRQLNYTLVSLIPKVTEPQNMSQLRSIALFICCTKLLPRLLLID